MPTTIVKVRPGTHYLHVTWAHVMLRVQLGCERRFDIEFYGADSHFCHSVYVTWSHVELWSADVPARLSYFCCRTHFVRREVTWREDSVSPASGSLRRISHAIVSIRQSCGVLRWINIIPKDNCPHSHGRENVNITIQHRILAQRSLSRTAYGRCVFQNSATSSATSADVLRGLPLSLIVNVGLITRLTPRPLPSKSIPIQSFIVRPSIRHHGVVELQQWLHCLLIVKRRAITRKRTAHAPPNAFQ
jgi:hypothetical protein